MGKTKMDKETLEEEAREKKHKRIETRIRTGVLVICALLLYVILSGGYNELKDYETFQEKGMSLDELKTPAEIKIDIFILCCILLFVGSIIFMICPFALARG